MNDISDTEKFPLVSAIMLAGRSSVSEVLAGIKCFKAQTYPYKELIILNNARTQFEASGLNIAAEPDVFLVDTPGNLITGMARNYGIRSANGQILAQFDADCYHDPQRLEAQIATLADNNSHICMLSSTLQYSYFSGRASLQHNQRAAILNTMVFIRPSDIDYPPSDKMEESGLLEKMMGSGLKAISMNKPELCCKFYHNTCPVKSCVNHGLSNKQFSLVKRLVKKRSGEIYGLHRALPTNSF